MELCEQIFEIRYKPNAKILDYRGAWAEFISEHMNLSEWRILENRIDIFDASKEDHAFIGFRNAGFVSRKLPTKNYFYERTIKLLNYLSSIKEFGSQLTVERIGVRSRYCRPFGGDFDALKDKYENHYLSLTNRAKRIINAKLVDIGAPLSFIDDVGTFNTTCGPMEEEQITQFFNGRMPDDIPKVGLYYDIDYFVRPNKTMDIKEVNSTIKAFSEKSWNRYENIAALVMGE